jgi:hypothetical protein
MGTPSKIAQKVANGALGVNMEHTLNSNLPFPFILLRYGSWPRKDIKRDGSHTA